MRELMLGLIAVAVFVGIVVGRNTERARRTYKDWDAAKTALKKGRGIALGEMRKAAVTILVIAAVLVGLFTLAIGGGASAP